MYPNNGSYRNTPDALSTHTLNTMHSCGLNAGQFLAAEARHLDLAAQQLAMQRTAPHSAPKQAPRKWRQWSGNVLVRAGNRLQGVVVPTGTQIPSEPH
jgi:hypothetical protein